ncbi:MAG TPA: hypothetical protein VFM58_16055 [Solirubrobacteraceae bacterium]|nr:hypothetical protein [Solirubrobacteraceae bacterium]
MSEANYQTVRLAKGRHWSPDSGVCVVELASMLAGEPFSDHPRSVCPTIAAFLRAYNDGLDDKPRQELFRFAAAVVGTRSSRAVEAARQRLCAEWCREQQSQAHPRRSRFWNLLGFGLWESGGDTAATTAGRLAARNVARKRPGAGEAAEALVSRLIGCGAAAAVVDEHRHASEPAATLP